MNEIKIFENKEFGTVRTVDINGEPWLVAKDVAEALGYQNPAKAIHDHVDDEDKLNNESLSSLGQRGGWLINESGMYTLAITSKLPRAKEFRRWVTSEVLPSIRKHGMYAIQDILDNPDIAIAALTELKAEREKRKQVEEMNAIQKQQIAELQPKASYYDLILQSKDVVAVTQISKDYGMSAKEFNGLLHKFGVQYKMNKTWFLYQKYAENGYTQSKTHLVDDGRTVMHTYWTQKGRLFLYELLKSNDILPVIERDCEEEE